MKPTPAPPIPMRGISRRAKPCQGKLVSAAHALMENPGALWARLLVDFQINVATGKAERDAVPELLDRAVERGFHPRSVGSDKGYDTKECVRAQRERGVTPHVTQNEPKPHRSAVDRRTTRHPGYAVSLRIRKRVEEIFGWMKTVGGFRRTRTRGLAKTQLAGYQVAAAYNLVRMSKLTANAAA